MRFDMFMVPPRTTAQMKKVRVVNGKPMFYEPPEVKEAHTQLVRHLKSYAPETPMEGPVELYVRWSFPAGLKHKDGEWKITRPDTDNLQKLLKDCMTETGFWHDDAQVVIETVEKIWALKPGIYISVENLEEKDGKKACKRSHTR